VYKRQDAINRRATPDPAKYVPIDAVTDLMRDRMERVGAAQEAEVETAVNAALNKGYISPGMRDWATSLCRSNPQSFDAFLKSAPAPFAHLFQPSKLDGRTPPMRKSAEDDAETAICRQLGIQPGRLAEH